MANKQNEEEVQQYKTDVHKLSKEELRTNYETDFKQGLSEDQALRKQEAFGKNQLTPPKEKHVIVKFFLNLLDPFNLMLLVASLASFIVYIVIGKDATDNLILGVVLGVVVLFTNIFGTYQEYSSNQLMKGFQNFLPQSVNIMRDGKVKQLPAVEIVPGDIVMIKAGEKIPADLVILECSQDCRVDNSSLTGECEPQHRRADMTNDEPMETENIMFFGTLIVMGHAKCMVYATGDNTFMGQVARISMETSSKTSPLNVEINRFVLLVSIFALSLGAGLAIFKLVEKKYQMIVPVFVGITVSNIPEGLTATVMVSLTLTARQMASKNVLVKSLVSVETLGSTSVICSDKTGTLTINKMTLANVYFAQKQQNVLRVSKEDAAFDVEGNCFCRLKRCSLLCNNAEFGDDGSIIGDASESALVKFFNDYLDESLNNFREKSEKVHGIPFNSKNKWQLSIHKCDGKNVLVMKGAPERIISYCDKILGENGIEELTPEISQEIDENMKSFAKKGQRVLAFCELELDSQMYPNEFVFEGDRPDNMNFPFPNTSKENGFVFLGLTALIDPPRPGVPDAVLKCQSAGIRVFMVTGDHPTTARAIAENVNIVRPGAKVCDVTEQEETTLNTFEEFDGDTAVITGAVINRFVENSSDDDRCRFWNAVLKNEYIVFSRTSPQNKLQIVEACQQRNSIVAVTGDGVNDAPALKKADIGIAMGITGTDVAKEAANMILLDDNFVSIVAAIESGRILFDNLKKSIAYTLSSNIPEILPFILNSTIKIPLPLQTIQIFVIDLGTDLLPAISMAYEEKESDIMSRKPRNPKIEKLVDAQLVAFAYLKIGTIQALSCMLAYLLVFLDDGFHVKYLVNLDKNHGFVNCDGFPDTRYLTCSTEKKFENRYCMYSKNFYNKTTNLPVDNIECRERESVLRRSQAAYVYTIIHLQHVDVVISKTRRNSVFFQGFNNLTMSLGILSEYLIILLLVATPVKIAFQFELFAIKHLTTGMLFFVIIFVYDELRKKVMRSKLDSRISRILAW